MSTQSKIAVAVVVIVLALLPGCSKSDGSVQSNAPTLRSAMTSTMAAAPQGASTSANATLAASLDELNTRPSLRRWVPFGKMQIRLEFVGDPSRVDGFSPPSTAGQARQRLMVSLVITNGSKTDVSAAWGKTTVVIEDEAGSALPLAPGPRLTPAARTPRDGIIDPPKPVPPGAYIPLESQFFIDRAPVGYKIVAMTPGYASATWTIQSPKN
jgi:hypothetical protein